MLLLVVVALVCLLAGAAIGAVVAMAVTKHRRENAGDEPSAGDTRSGFRI